MSNVTVDTWVRTILLLLALTNQILTLFGVNPIPVSEEDAYTALTAVFTVVITVWSWWKNNSFTKKAIEADQHLKDSKTLV